MARELLQHMVEEADAGRDVELAGAVEVDGRRGLGLLGLAREGALPLKSRPLGRSLRRRNRAFISLSPAVKDPPSRARFPYPVNWGATAMQSHGSQPAEPQFWHATTILTIRKDGRVVIAGDGQVSLGATIIKANARK